MAPRPLTEGVVRKITADLEQSPAQPFDLARQVRVLSTKFQFVEFSLKRAALSRKRVAVPPDLLGLGSDASAEELLRASFQVVGKGDETSGDTRMKRRDEIEKKYLVSIAHYGKIILQSNRAEFDKDVNALKDEAKAFRQSATSKLDVAIQKNCAEVIARLLPVVRLKPPKRWRANLGANPSQDHVRRRLEEDLKSAYGEAADCLNRIDVRLIYTRHHCRNALDEDFAKATQKARLYLDEMYEEYQAARART